MTITAAQADTFVAKVGGSVPEMFGTDAIINMAGRQMVQLARWNWLRGPEALVDLVKDQDFITLPTDFGRMAAIEVTSDSGYTTTLVDIGTIAEYRNSNYNQSSGYALAMTYGPGASPDYVPSVPRLEIWPTPSETKVGGLRLFYYRKWVEVSGANGSSVVLNMPSFMEMVFWRLLREMTLAFEEDDMASLEQRVDSIANSGLVAMARREDMMQPFPVRGAPVINGVGMRARRDLFVYPDSVPAP